METYFFVEGVKFLIGKNLVSVREPVGFSIEVEAVASLSDSDSEEELLSMMSKVDGYYLREAL